jgi:hypothetical protein
LKPLRIRHSAFSPPGFPNKGLQIASQGGQISIIPEEFHEHFKDKESTSDIEVFFVHYTRTLLPSAQSKER